MSRIEEEIHIITCGGIGDVILLTPTLREIKKRLPHTTLTVHAIDKKHYEVLVHNPHIDALRLESKPYLFCMNLLRKTGYLPKRYQRPSYGDYAPSVWFPQKHATKLIAELMGLQLSDPTPEVFLMPEEESSAKATMDALKNPIAIQVKSSTVNKEWPLKHWKELIARNRQCDFVQLGVREEPRLEGTVDIPEGLDLRSEFALLKYSRAFVGVESCFAHVTNAFGIRGVVLFGSSSPEVWGHPNNINLSTGVRCSPCIDIIAGNKCPYGVECLEVMAVEQVEEALKKQLAAAAVQSEV